MMQLSIASGDFAKAMKIARKVMPNKGSLPAYEYVHLFQRDGDYFLRAQNGEEVAELRVPFELRGGNFMELALRITDFSEMLSALPAQCLDLTFSDPNDLDGGGLVEVVYENGHYSLPYSSVGDFPLPVPLEESVSMTVPTGVICGAMRTALLHVAQDTLRPVMNTVAVDFKADRYAVVASDGHTLFLDEYLGNLEGGKTMTAMISAGCVALIDFAVQSYGDESVVMETNGLRFRVVGRDFSLQSRLIEGRYPNYMSVIPQSAHRHVVLEKKAFSAALRRVLLMSNTHSRLVKFTFKEENLLLTSQDVDFSTAASETLPLVEMKDVPDGFDIGFKGDYLHRILSSAASDNLSFDFIDDSSAALVQEVDGKTDKVMVIMPMQL